MVSNTFYFHLYLGKCSNSTNIFQMGWNYQPVHLHSLTPKSLTAKALQKWLEIMEKHVDYPRFFRKTCGPNHLHAMIYLWGFELKDFWRNMFPIGDSPISDPTPHSMYGRFTYIWYHLVNFYGKCKQYTMSVWAIFLKTHSSMLEIHICCVALGGSSQDS